MKVLKRKMAVKWDTQFWIGSFCSKEHFLDDWRNFNVVWGVDPSKCINENFLILMVVFHIFRRIHLF